MKAGLSFKTNANIYPILRQNNLPPLPSATSSLENKLPTVVQTTSKNYIIFDEKGPTVHDLDSEHSFSDPRLSVCWGLVDSNEHIMSPCQHFLTDTERIIQTSSPTSERWKDCVKQRIGTYITVSTKFVATVHVTQ